MSEHPPAWQAWQLDTIDDGKPKPRLPLKKSPIPNGMKMPTAAELEQVHQDIHAEARRQGYEEGHAEGKAIGLTEGRAEGEKAGREAAAQLLAVAARLDQALAQLDGDVADELTALALEVARQALCQTIDYKPETILGVVREAIGQLSHQHANIYLHPEDASLVRMYSGDQLAHAGHRIQEDTHLKRGDVVIESGGAQIDGTVANRWKRVVGSLGLQLPWGEEDKAENKAEK